MTSGNEDVHQAAGKERSPTSSVGAARKSALGRHFRSGRVFMAGIATAALTAVLTQVMTGWMGDAWKFMFGPPEPAPIAMVVQPPHGDMCDQAWMVPRSSQGLPPPPGSGGVSGGEEWSRWAESVRGVPADAAKGTTGGYLVLIVQGRTDAQVTITNIKFKAVKRDPAFSGTFAYTNCGAGPGEIRWLDVDLDMEPPQVSADFAEWHPELRPGASTETSASERRPISFPYNLMVSKSETETFLISAHTEDCDCTWIGQLDWASQGRTGSLPIDNNGAPFRTASTLLADRECWTVMGTRPWQCR